MKQLKNQILCKQNHFRIITSLMVALLLSFPIYAHIFFQSPKKNNYYPKFQNSDSKVEFTIKGMTCSGCEHHIKTEVSKLKGIIEVVVSMRKGNAIVKFDNKQTSIAEIEKAINSTGYKSLKVKLYHNGN